MHTKLLSALYVRTRASSGPRARHIGESALSLPLLTTAQQARRAARVPPSEAQQPSGSRQTSAGRKRKFALHEMFLGSLTEVCHRSAKILKLTDGNFVSLNR